MKLKRKRGPAKALKRWEALQPLVELYNLHLDSSESDKEKLREYLKKYASHIFRRKADASTFVFSYNKPRRDYGTLDQFKKAEGRDWFESKHVEDLCTFLMSLLGILDLYIDKKFRGKHFQALSDLANTFRPSFAFEDRVTGESLSWERLWEKEIDCTRIKPIFGKSLEIRGLYFGLDIGRLLALLTRSVLTVIEENIRIIRCARRGCHNIYIPKPGAPTTGKAPKYCPACRSKRKT